MRNLNAFMSAPAGARKRRGSRDSPRSARIPRCSIVEALESRILCTAPDPNLAAWFKADSIGLAAGAAVSSWADSTGHGFNAAQANASQQPHLLALSNG